MPHKLTITNLRKQLADAGWELTELAGGPWIIYGFNGDAELCVMSKTREQAWLKAYAASELLAADTTRNGRTRS